MWFNSWFSGLVSNSQLQRARSTRHGGTRRTRALGVRPGFEVLEERTVPSAAAHDVLYVGDGADNSVKSFDAATGAYLGALVAPGSGGVDGPRGMIFRNPAKLIVVNQNVDQNFSGDILRYNGQTGAPLVADALSVHPNAPFA